MVCDPTASVPILTPEQHERFAADGFVRLGRLYDRRDVDRIGTVITTTLARGGSPANGASRLDIGAAVGESLPILNRPSRAEPVLARHARNPRVAAAVADLLGAREMRLLEDQVIVKLPRASGPIHWHQDSSYWPLTPTDHISCWLALDETTELSGALQYVPGSHRDGSIYASIRLARGEPRDHEFGRPAIPIDPAREGHPVTTVELAPGEIVLHHARTWHASLPNRAQHERRGVVTRFVASGTRVDGRRRALHPPADLAQLADGELLAGDLFPVVWPSPS